MIAYYFIFLVIIVYFMLFEHKYKIYAFFGYGEMIEVTDFQNQKYITWKRKKDDFCYLYPLTKTRYIKLLPDGKIESETIYLQSWRKI